jgi:hypothetical protein
MFIRFVWIVTRHSFYRAHSWFCWSSLAEWFELRNISEAMRISTLFDMKLSYYFLIVQQWFRISCWDTYPLGYFSLHCFVLD